VNQSSLRYLGLFDLLLVAAFLALFGPASFLALPVPLMTLAGLSLIVAGSVAEVSVGPLTVRWRQLVGLSYALFAVLTPLSLLPSLGEPSTLDLLLLVSSIVGGLTLLYIGYDVVRGGEHFSMTADVDTEIGL
jgi:hypothetical protein